MLSAVRLHSYRLGFILWFRQFRLVATRLCAVRTLCMTTGLSYTAVLTVSHKVRRSNGRADGAQEWRTVRAVTVCIKAGRGLVG
jgi:hypothetical protein